MKSKVCKTALVIAFGCLASIIFVMSIYLVGCNQNSQQNKSGNDPIVGQWETSYISTDQPGKKVPVIFSIKQDGKAYWMTLADSAGYQITNISLDTWEKQAYNTYSFTDTTENIYQYQYNKDTDTIISGDSDLTLTRLDPIVGIWTGVAADEVGSGNSSIVFKSDGTAISTVAFENGTADVYNLTWKKKSNNDYDIYSGDRLIRTYTVIDDGNGITTDDNRSKIKCFTDSTFIVSIIGAWYKPEKNYTTIFNADGTGFWSNHGQVANFTWLITANGVEVTYKDGVDSDGKDLTGVSYTWKYDRINNCFPSPNGSEYIRPTSSIPDLITFK